VASYFVASYEVHLPFDRLSDHRVVKQIIGGWSLSGITKLQSGTPVSISDSDDFSMTSLGDQAYWTPGSGPLILNRNPRNRDPANPKQALPFFNASFITSEANYAKNVLKLSPSQTSQIWGLNGNVRRRFFHGSGAISNDMSFLRDFHIHESHVVQFRADAFNVFNHANFANPSGTSTSLTEGVVTSSSGSARQLQFAVKYHF
jgi:hypothetical protein